MGRNSNLFGLCLVLVLAGCLGASDPSQSDKLTTRFTPSAHPTGTLLRDARGGYWMVGVWPERVAALNAYFETYRSGDEYDRAAITHVMACSSHFPGLLLRQ